MKIPTIMSVLEVKSTPPPSKKELTPSEKKAVYDAAMKKLKDGETARQESMRIQQTKICWDRINGWLTTTDLDHHFSQSADLNINTQNVSADDIKLMKDKLTKGGYKIVDMTSGFKVTF